MAEHKVEHVSGGEVREFSAIKGEGKSGHGPSGKDYGDKPAIAKWPPKSENKGE